MVKFNFTGVLGFNALDAKLPPIRLGKTKNGANYKSLNAFITLPNKNRANLELFGMESKTIKTKDKDGNDVEFAWEDRNDEGIVNNIAFYRTNVISIDDERHTFVTPLDMINYLWEHVEDFRGKTVTVTGNVRRTYYKGKYSDRFEMQNLYVADENAKPGFRTTMEFYWDKEGIDIANFADEHRIYINGYNLEYDATSKSNVYMPRQVILDTSKIDWDNPKHAAIAGFNLKTMGIEYVNGKVKVILGKGYHANRLVCSYSNGAKEVEFDESQLTDFQKTQIELGLAELEDFRPRNGIRGEFVTEYKITKFDSVGDYAEGTVKLDVTDGEFEEMIFVPDVQEKSVEEVVEPKQIDVTVDDDDEELFG